MKNFTIAIIAITFAMQLTATAKTFDVVLSNPSKEVYTLNYKGKSDVVKVRIMDKAGKTVYQEKIKGMDSFSRPYNFSQMPAGEYTIEVKNSEGVVRENFTHTVDATENSNFSMIKLIEGKKENSVDLVVIRNSNEKMIVDIMVNDKKVFSDKIDQVGSFKKSFVISNDIAKDYKFLVNGVEYTVSK